MQIAAMILGILAVLGMLVGFFPCLGALNWLNIPFAVIGLIISIVALVTAKEENKTGSIVGVSCCGAAVIFGALRLLLGAGCV